MALGPLVLVLLAFSCLSFQIKNHRGLVHLLAARMKYMQAHQDGLVGLKGPFIYSDSGPTMEL